MDDEELRTFLVQKTEDLRKKHLNNLAIKMKESYEEHSNLIEKIEKGEATFVVSVFPDYFEENPMLKITSKGKLEQAISQVRREALKQGKTEIKPEEYAVFVVEGNTHIAVPEKYWEKYIK
jgi:hypothetical protein